MSKRISMILIDDASSSRTGAVARIRAQPGFRVLAVLAETEAALQQVRETKPDIVLLNLRQEDDDSLTLAGALHGEAPESRVIIMGVVPPRQDVASFIRAGVSGFIMAGASFDEFLRAIHSVARGMQVLPLELTRPLFAQLKRYSVRGCPKKQLDVKRLTTREREVADLIVRGCNNQEIAIRLQIALNTVTGHVRKVLSKLAVNNRLEVAALSRGGVASALVPRPGAEPVSALAT